MTRSYAGASAYALLGAEIGIGLTTAGVLFLFLGMLFLFDSVLLSMGDVRRTVALRASLLTRHSQLLFLSGVVVSIGPRATARFFTKRRNYKGSGAFGAGVLAVLLGWAITGMAVQSYGLILLFADFVPTALPFAKRVPGLGALLSLPPIKAVRFTTSCR